MSAIFTIPFDHAGLDPKVATVIDDVVTAIQTWANKSSISATSSGSFVQPRCYYFLSAAQSLQTATTTAVLWTGPAQAAEDSSVAGLAATQYDNGVTFGASAFVAAASTADLVPPMLGQYLVIAGASFAASAVGERQLAIERRVAGVSTQVGFVNMPTNIAGNATWLQVSAIVPILTQGDSVRVTALQSSGGNLNLAAGQTSTYVRLIKLS